MSSRRTTRTCARCQRSDHANDRARLKQFRSAFFRFAFDAQMLLEALRIAWFETRISVGHSKSNKFASACLINNATAHNCLCDSMFAQHLPWSKRVLHIKVQHWEKCREYMLSRSLVITDDRWLTLMTAAPCQACALRNNSSGGWVAHRKFAKRR